MRIPRNDVVICPECVHEFYAICVDDQKARSAAEARIRELEVALRDVCYALPSKASVAKRQALNILVPNAGLTAETACEFGDALKEFEDGTGPLSPQADRGVAK